MIDSDVPLVLIVVFAGSAAVVVRRARGRRLRIPQSRLAATGSMRSAGIVLFRNGVRDSIRSWSSGSKMTGTRPPIASVKTPRRWSRVGTVDVDRAIDQSAAGPDSRQRRTSGRVTSGPPMTPPNWLRSYRGLSGFERWK